MQISLKQARPQENQEFLSEQGREEEVIRRRDRDSRSGEAAERAAQTDSQEGEGDGQQGQGEESDRLQAGQLLGHYRAVYQLQINRVSLLSEEVLQGGFRETHPHLQGHPHQEQTGRAGLDQA